MQFYKNLKRARTLMGKSQIEVAKAIGISNAALSNYETGYREPDLDTLSALASYYGFSLDELVNMNPHKSEPILDLSKVLKNKRIAFKGQIYELKESQKKSIIQALEEIFENLSKAQVHNEETATGPNRHPHIHRRGLLR